jgi:hypothetical protein
MQAVAAMLACGRGVLPASLERGAGPVPVQVARLQQKERPQPEMPARRVEARRQHSPGDSRPSDCRRVRAPRQRVSALPPVVSALLAAPCQRGRHRDPAAVAVATRNEGLLLAAIRAAQNKRAVQRLCDGRHGGGPVGHMCAHDHGCCACMGVIARALLCSSMWAALSLLP